MKNIFKFATMAFAALAFASCNEKEPVQENKEPEQEITENLTFTLTLDEVTDKTAKISISHNGTKDDTWYGFHTTEKDIEKAVENKVEELTSKDKVSGLKKSTKYSASLSNLEPETEYTYIAFGMTEKGETYGKTAHMTFTTKAEEVPPLTEFTETSTWKITYAGREVVEGNKMDQFTVECEEGNRYYFTTFPEIYLEYYGITVKEYVESEAEYVDILLENGYTIADLTSDKTETWSAPRMESGDYICLAIGYDGAGKATYEYSSQKITIEEEEATADYNKWIGTYTFTSANNINYTISIDHYDNNYLYLVNGWEVGSELNEEGMDFGTAFNGYVPSFLVYYNNGELVFNEYIITGLTVTNEKNQNVECDLGLYGYGMNGTDLSILLADGGTIAVGKTTDNGATGTINGVKMDLEDGSSIDVYGMGYAAIATDYSTYFVWNQPAQFPITMTKLESRPAAQSVKYTKRIMDKKRPDFSLTAKADKTMEL